MSRGQDQGDGIMGPDRTRSKTPRFTFRLDELFLISILIPILFVCGSSVFREEARARGEWKRTLSRDGKLIAVVADPENAVFDVEGGARLYPLPERTWSIDFAPSGKLLAVATRDGVTLRDGRTGKVQHRFRGRYSGSPVRFSRGGSLLAASRGRAPEVHVWDVEGHRRVLEFRPELHRVRFLDFLADDAVVIGGPAPKRPGLAVSLLDVTHGEERSRFGGPELHVLGIGDSPDGAVLATYRGWPQRYSDWPLRIRDLRDGEVVLRAKTGGGQPLALSADGQMYATREDQSVKVWAMGEESPRWVFRGHSRPVSDAVFIEDDQVLVTAARDAAVCTWDLATGRLLRKSRGLSLLPEPVPWAAVALFGAWLVLWTTPIMSRTAKASGAGERKDRGPKLLALVATLFVVSCVDWIAWFAASSPQNELRLIGVALCPLAMGGAFLAAIEVVEVQAGRFPGQFVFGALSFVLAVSVATPNLFVLIETPTTLLSLLGP